MHVIFFIHHFIKPLPGDDLSSDSYDDCVIDLNANIGKATTNGVIDLFVGL